MCGIAGILNYTEPEKISDVIKKMNSTIIHRGPDDVSYYLDSYLAVGFRRLSIIDLKHGQQPLLNEDKTIVCFANGEIYNFMELKRDLLRDGHKFNTSCDTEVIPHLYEVYGIDFVLKLNGMFFILLWDKKEKKLFLYRDQFGVKPCYYSLKGKTLFFASEIKAILSGGISPEINEINRDMTIKLNYSPSPETVFKYIYNLQPGYYLSIKNDDFQVKRYYKLSPSITGFNSIDNGKGKMIQLLRESVRLQVRADVPVGVFLSGGIDSTIIACLAAEFQDQVYTFSTKLHENAFDESELAKIVAKKINSIHHTVEMQTTDAARLIANAMWFGDNLLLDPSFINIHHLSKYVANYAKVVLSGIGGDEGFAGYPRHIPYKNQYIFKQLPVAIKKVILAIQWLRGWQHYYPYNIMENFKNGFWYHYVERISYFTFEEINRAMINPPGEKQFQNYFESLFHDSIKDGYVNTILYMDMIGSIFDWLLMIQDRATMGATIEGRVPFCDINLMEYAFSIPGDTIKTNDLRENKYFLKMALKEILPAEIINAPKRGFSAPVPGWMRSTFGKLADEIIGKIKPESIKIFKEDYLKYLLCNKTLTHMTSVHLYMIVAYAIWHQIHVVLKLESPPGENALDLF